ncbi:MAG TPA: DUF4386 family protein [Ktedonobacterales bacterium]|jgi:hypothetical protein
METARLKLQGIYSLLAGVLLLVGVTLYQSLVLGPAGYHAPADAAFSHGDYGPLLSWIGDHSSAFVIFRILELLIFLLILRLPFALHRAFRSYGRTLARWMLATGLSGLALFAAMIALSTISFINAAADYRRQAPSSAAAKDIVSSFSGLYGAEALAQNTLGGILLAIFLICASLLIARSGKLQNLLVYFGLLAAALMAALALLFAVSPPEAQTQLTTPTLASFAVWLIWLGILLIRRAPRLIATATAATTPAEQAEETLSASAAAATQENPPEQASVSPSSEAAPSKNVKTPDANTETAQHTDS